jgi:hypothetical protein
MERKRAANSALSQGGRDALFAAMRSDLQLKVSAVGGGSADRAKEGAVETSEGNQSAAELSRKEG